MLKSRIAVIVATVITVALTGFWTLADINLIVFKAGDPIKAEEVNANFQNLASGITANVQDIQNLENTLPTKFNFTVAKDDLDCEVSAGSITIVSCLPFVIDHPSVNGKRDVWVSYRVECNLFVSQDYPCLEDGAQLSGLTYDKTLQKWVMNLNPSEWITEMATGDNLQQIGFNVLVIP